MQSEMDRLFGGTFGRLPQAAETTEWAPAIDVTAENGGMVIRAELPGVKREDVDVSVHNGVLAISGEHKEETEQKTAGYLVRERRYGSFRRSMTLPEGVDADEIKASFEDGVLEVKIPGSAPAVEELPKKIELE
ncbi:Hsp20/alpha crystallin family protein [Rubrobacter marinus]|uniref:Hsp20/alpha crystallin family protein n=1 Tax=Rubrobacter marinus TaxID=2653852 RepID=UPI001D18D670|nr:Hsp20/alpha crystallin family protein [Rubrobacter marinus]